MVYAGDTSLYATTLSPQYKALLTSALHNDNATANS